MKKLITFLVILLPLISFSQYIGMGPGLVNIELNHPDYEYELNDTILRVYDDGLINLYFLDHKVVKQESVLLKRRWTRWLQRDFERNWNREKEWYWTGISQCKIITNDIGINILVCIKRDTL
jgi:hypothetical protein